MLGAVACLFSLVVFKHLRGAAIRGLRRRAGRANDRAHEEHVHDSKARGNVCLNRDAKDIVRCESGPAAWNCCCNGSFGGVMRFMKFAAGNLTTYG
jgi:hypothetical protein